MKMLAPRVRAGTPEVLREIGTVPVHDRVLSVYIDLDPAEFGTGPARAAAVRSLLDLVERVAEGQSASDAQAIRDYVTRGGFPSRGASALAIFAALPTMFEVVTLPRAVASTVVVDDGPALSAVASLISVDRWCVLLASRARARVLLGTPYALAETIELEDDVHRKHEQGGWSQARYQRSVEVDVDRHLDNVAARVRGLYESKAFDLLALGCTPEFAPRVLEAFPNPVRERFFERFDVDVDNTKVPEIAAAAEPLFARRDWERLSDALGRVAEGLGGGPAAAGPADVARALEMRSVRILIIEPRTENADRAIREALAQRADILVAPTEELEKYGRIAAVLRFP
jgi:peptide chain release factor subunit 1